jgi:hypothetical protein
MKPESRLYEAINIRPRLLSSLIGIQVVGFAVEEIVISCGNVGCIAVEI